MDDIKYLTGEQIAEALDEARKGVMMAVRELTTNEEVFATSIIESFMQNFKAQAYILNEQNKL